MHRHTWKTLELVAVVVGGGHKEIRAGIDSEGASELQRERERDGDRDRERDRNSAAGHEQGISLRARLAILSSWAGAAAR